MHKLEVKVSTILLYGIPIVSLHIDGQDRLCLAQISNTLLKQYSYNEIHNRRVALGITCVQCTPVQLEILRRAGAMPASSRRCGMITCREAERLCKSFLGDNAPPRLPDDFAFNVHHKCAWGCRGSFLPSRYNSSRAKCIKCIYCGIFFSPNKFIFHSHRANVNDKYIQPDAANFNSWRRHMTLSGQPSEEIVHAWEDVKAMFNGGTRKRLLNQSSLAMQGLNDLSAQRPKQQLDQMQSYFMPATPLSTALSAVVHRSKDTRLLIQTNSVVPESQTTNIKYNSIQLSRNNALYNSTILPSTKSHCDQYVPSLGKVTSETVDVKDITRGDLRPITMSRTTYETSYQPLTAFSAQLRGSLNKNEMAMTPFPQSLMIDCMHHSHVAQSQVNSIQNAHPGNSCEDDNLVEPFGLSSFGKDWMKTSSIKSSISSLTQLPTVHKSCGCTNINHGIQCRGSKPNILTETATNSEVSLTNTNQQIRKANKLNSLNISALPQLVTSSAFKPVLQHKQKHALNSVASIAHLFNFARTSTSQEKLSLNNSTREDTPKLGVFDDSSLTTRIISSTAAETPLSSTTSIALTVHANFCTSTFGSSLPQSSIPSLQQSSLTGHPRSPPPAKIEDRKTPEYSMVALNADNIGGTDTDIKYSTFSADVESSNTYLHDFDLDSDDEVVDIETTEDEIPDNNSFKVVLSMASNQNHQNDNVESSLAVYKNDKTSKLVEFSVENTSSSICKCCFKLQCMHSYKDFQNKPLIDVDKSYVSVHQSPAVDNNLIDIICTPAKHDHENNLSASIKLIDTGCTIPKQNDVKLETSLNWRNMLK